MAVYNDILSWAANKPEFLKDALRRIISASSLTNTDIDELVSLLKKECGDTSVTLNAIPIDNTYIPTIETRGTVYPKLISIKEPINICALYEGGNLQFPNTGLSVVYGNNGSGKSSYSRILKKLCWSRSSSLELKKNVFFPSAAQQKVDFTIDISGTNIHFRWLENAQTHPTLNSIFVYDNDCGNIYVNSENPAQYKPVGIDVLEKLIPVLNAIAQRLDSEVASYITIKPTIDQSLSSTITAQWYTSIENRTRVDIERHIQFSSTEFERKTVLFRLINSQNPHQNIQTLTSLKARIENYIQQFSRIEDKFSDANIENLQRLRRRFESVKHAYDIATTELNDLNTIAGFGTNPWRILWEAAKNFASSSGLSDGQAFPSGISLEKCVLCQQELDELAKHRLAGFNRFILNDISSQFRSVQLEFQDKYTAFNTLSVPPYENISELAQLIPEFQSHYNTFTQSVNTAKTAMSNYLQNGGVFNNTVYSISTLINNLLPNIATQLEQNNQLNSNRNTLVAEYNELLAKEFLFNNKTTILQYHTEYCHKAWLSICQSKLNINVSRKIGELMEDQAVALQHQEFVNHLNYFNSDLSSKVVISKTRTTQGSTYQRCGLNGITHTIDSVLSEGEKKIIALSNFLADCTIDNRKNSMVFDDPVTSLDMDYRDSIARKIVELSRDRQIIVLTHDLYFVRLLLDIHRRQIGQDCHILGVEKHRGFAGVVTDEIPYLAKNIQERINSIRRDLDRIDALPLNQFQREEEITEKLKKQFRKLLVDFPVKQTPLFRWILTPHFEPSSLS